MVTLNVERINNVAPYHVIQRKPGFFVFHTDSGIRYFANFTSDEMVTSSDSYQFSLINVDNKPSPRDTKLRDTVIAIIKEFFDSNQSTMLYLCETADGRQGMRNRLFAHWFKSFANEDEYIYRHTEVIIDDVMNFLSIILRRDNPDATLVIDEWESSILALGIKPQQ